MNDAHHLVQERLVAQLRAQAGEAGGDLGVEDAAQLGGPLAAQQRHVLAPGVEDDLDVGVGQQLRQRRGIELLGQRVEDLDADAVVGLDRDLDQAQQRAIAPLAHELRVDAQPPRGSRLGGELCDDPVCHQVNLRVQRPFGPRSSSGQCPCSSK